jgi:8-oxo-dGTP pyrophosphatase MutT (NUDIX family)
MNASGDTAPVTPGPAGSPNTDSTSNTDSTPGSPCTPAALDTPATSNTPSISGTSAAPGTSDTSGPAIARAAARVILIDGEGRVLLFRGGDSARPEAGSWWFTPGGGVEAGESLVQAARREVFEETGHVLPDDLGPVIWTRTSRFLFEGLLYEQAESFYRAVAAHSRVDYSGWTEIERRNVSTHRWWTRDELRETREQVYPEELVDLLGDEPPAPD